jgi:hemerythrin-like domain-containing protein
MATQTAGRSSNKSTSGKSADKPAETKAQTTRTPRSNGNNRRNGTSSGTSSGTLIGVATAGIAVGIVAMIGRKVAVQAPTLLAGDWDEALKAEHQATLKVVDALQATTASHGTKRGMLLANLKHMLSKHAFQEENVVYPALRDAGRTEEADDLNREHGYVKQALYELTKSVKTDDIFLATLSKLRSDLEAHMDEEENTLFPQLKASLSAEQNAVVTKAMNREGFKLA